MTIKTKEEIRMMAKVGKLAARCLEHTAKFVRPGITTDELDKIAHDYTLSHGAKPAPPTQIGHLAQRRQKGQIDT